MGFTGLSTIFVVAAAVSWSLTVGVARAANGAYAVDAADISEAGSCKVESWISAATNTDFSAVANPSCVVDIFKPVELSLLTNRFRNDGDWSTNIVPKAKTNLVPTGIGKFGFSFYAAGSFDALTGENLALFAVVPATYRLSETKVYRCLAVDNRGIRSGRRVRCSERGPAPVSDRRPLSAQRDLFRRCHLRSQHHGRECQLDHDRDHDPFSRTGQ